MFHYLMLHYINVRLADIAPVVIALASVKLVADAQFNIALF